MKSILYTVIFLIGLNILCAQKYGQDLIDSLKTDLSKTKEDTMRAYLMTRIAYAYGNINAEEAIRYGTDALKLSQSIAWEKGIGEAQYFRGNAYLYAAKYPEALDDYFSALNYYERTKNNDRIAGLLSNIGGVYSYQRKNDKALEYFFKALNLNRSIGTLSDFDGINLANIGMIYMEQKEFPKALEHLYEGLGISEKYHFNQLEASILDCISLCYVEMNEPIKAYQFAEKAMAKASLIVLTSIIATGYFHKGMAISNALTTHNQLFLKTLFHDNINLAILKSKIYLDSAIFLNKTLNDKNRSSEIYKELSELEEFKGNFKEALRFHKLFKTLSDTIYNTDNKEKILQTTLEYDFDKKVAATHAEQEKKDLVQKNVRNSIVIGLLGAIIFASIVWRQRNKISKEKRRSEELLLNILPEEVAEELKEYGKADAKHYDNVTVMFADFVSFTQIAEQLSPTELVYEIDHCFKAFDHIIEKYKIEKIKTIGDAYMCASGLPVEYNHHAIDIINAAMEFLSFLENYNKERTALNLAPFQLRIGINSGQVVAGIVGVKKFAYDIWGDTVNIASRMESSGESGKINISGSSYELVKEKFKCTYRGKIQAKNKGEIDMYFVESLLYQTL